MVFCIARILIVCFSYSIFQLKLFCIFINIVQKFIAIMHLLCYNRLQILEKLNKKQLVPRQNFSGENRETGEKPVRSRHCMQFAAPFMSLSNWEGGAVYRCEPGDLPVVVPGTDPDHEV
jgi:hypothetical protein